MNERIKELSLQCGAWHQVYDQKRLMVDRHFDIEKFCQLIVRECAEFVRKQNYESMRNEESYNIASTDILKHFGVKE